MGVRVVSHMIYLYYVGKSGTDFHCLPPKLDPEIENKECRFSVNREPATKARPVSSARIHEECPRVSKTQRPLFSTFKKQCLPQELGGPNFGNKLGHWNHK